MQQSGETFVAEGCHDRAGTGCFRQALFRLAIHIDGLLVVVVAIVIPMVTVAIRPMVVGHVAAFSIPVTIKVALSIMVGLHPVCAGVGRAGPVPFVPLIVAAHRIPVAAYPGIIGPGTSRLDPEHTDRWGCADSHSDGKLREDTPRCQQCQDNQFSFHEFDSFSRYTNS